MELYIAHSPYPHAGSVDLISFLLVVLSSATIYLNHYYLTMSSLKEYSLNITEQEYHDLPAWSYSVIAKYAKEGFSSLATLHDKFAPTPSMEFGSLFDSMITKGKATFDDYTVDDTSVPPAEKSVFDYLISQGINGSFDEISDTVLNIAIENCPTFASKYKKWDTRRAKLNECKSYYEARRTGKKIVSKQDWDDAAEMYNIFRKDSYLKDIFGTKNTDDVEYIYQSKFVLDYVLPSERTVQIKFMPDLIIVNHKDKTIRPVDLKTSSMPAHDWWKENFVKYRYDIQANLYSTGLSLIIDKDPELQNYTILPYLFTDISRTDKVPVTYEYAPLDESQINGLTFYSGDKTYTYKGWEVLLDEIISYEETQAKVPSYIKTDGPNNLLELLNN